MALYLLKVALVLPLLGGLAFGLLYAWRKLETRLPGAQAARLAELRETALIAAGTRLAVIRFDGRDVLIAVSRAGVVKLAEGSRDA